MIEIALGATLLAASALIVRSVRRRRRAVAARGPKPPRPTSTPASSPKGARGLRVGDVLLYGDSELWLAGSIALEEPGTTLRLFPTPGSERGTWVAQSRSRGSRSRPPRPLDRGARGPSPRVPSHRRDAPVLAQARPRPRRGRGRASARHDRTSGLRHPRGGRRALAPRGGLPGRRASRPLGGTAGPGPVRAAPRRRNARLSGPRESGCTPRTPEIRRTGPRSAHPRTPGWCSRRRRPGPRG